MTSPAPPDRALLLANLQATRDAFRSAVTGLSDVQARFKPSAECWSIEQIVEHVTVAEHGMYTFITRLHEVSLDPHSAESSATLARASDRKSKPLAAPDRALPKGRFEGLQAALDKFLENRERTIEFVKNCRDDLRLRIIHHPLGLLNGEDCLVVLINHPARHVEQINEIKADRAFPK
jgi:uncharacterized damage-inducible protein DinB